MKLSKRSFALASAATASIFYSIANLAFKSMMQYGLITPGRFADKLVHFPGHLIIKLFNMEQISVMNKKFLIIDALTGFVAVFFTALVAGFIFAAFYNKISSRAQ